MNFVNNLIDHNNCNILKQLDDKNKRYNYYFNLEKAPRRFKRNKHQFSNADLKSYSLCINYFYIERDVFQFNVNIKIFNLFNLKLRLIISLQNM